MSLDNETAAASYEKARDMLKKTIKSLASLWQQPVRGVVEVVYADKSSYTVDYRYELIQTRNIVLVVTNTARHIYQPML